MIINTVMFNFNFNAKNFQFLDLKGLETEKDFQPKQNENQFFRIPLIQ